jgi:hypothetical protein
LYKYTPGDVGSSAARARNSEYGLILKLWHVPFLRLLCLRVF